MLICFVYFLCLSGVLLCFPSVLDCTSVLWLYCPYSRSLLPFTFVSFLSLFSSSIYILVQFFNSFFSYLSLTQILIPIHSWLFLWTVWPLKRKHTHVCQFEYFRVCRPNYFSWKFTKNLRPKPLAGTPSHARADKMDHFINNKNSFTNCYSLPKLQRQTIPDTYVLLVGRDREH